MPDSPGRLLTFETRLKVLAETPQVPEGLGPKGFVLYPLGSAGVLCSPALFNLILLQLSEIPEGRLLAEEIQRQLLST